jgi:NADPH-dependent 2,4-dienoyl-CoA reductase/sulfur reductase-like enzyme
VHFCYEADSKSVPVGKNVVIIGSGHVGTESAIQLGRDGHSVTVIELTSEREAMGKKGSLGAPLAALSREAGVTFLYECSVEEINGDGILYRESRSGRKNEIKCDTVLLAAGVRPNRQVVGELRHAIAEGDVYLVGDLTDGGTIGHAVNSGFDIASHL